MVKIPIKRGQKQIKMAPKIGLLKRVKKQISTPAGVKGTKASNWTQNGISGTLKSIKSGSKVIKNDPF